MTSKTLTALCHINDLAEDSSKQFDFPDTNIFAVKKDGQLYVYKNICPHLGVELNWQEDQFLDMDGSLIQCATHGALFLIDNGECVAGPCLGESLSPIEFEIIDNVIHAKL